MITVLRADPSDLDRLSGVIAEAFFNLPPSPWLISDEAARRAIFPGYFRIHLEHGLSRGLVYTTPDRAGVALWLPAGTELPTLPVGYDERLVAVAGAWAGRFVAFDACLEARHPVGNVHHYLALLGVRPGRQGRGIGTALLETHHRLLDEQGIPAYLEASSDRNRELYLRHGYGDLGSPISLPSGGPSLFPMWREPSRQALPDSTMDTAEWHAGMTGVFRKPAGQLILGTVNKQRLHEAYNPRDCIQADTGLHSAHW